ncbi:sensor histidine kinase [Glycomyces albidus]|uniref:sensor histidine kinase n=1 Tax=Glycomyces albidus TaxID=2656774 RepID=UPI001883BFCB|nr:sensor histidine kinase [Glycomyces albidus]
MTAETAPRAPAVRRVISYLIPVGPVGSGTWRWRFRSVLALVGPGSVPFALALYGIQNQILRTNYEVGSPFLFAAATGGAVLLARFRPFAAWLVVMGVLAATVSFGDVDGWEPWPLTVPSLFALLVVFFALGRDRPIWLGALAWLGYAAIGSWVVWGVNSGRIPISYNAFANDNPGTENLLLGTLLGAFALLVGLTVRIWRQGRARVAEEERVAEDERQRRRLLEERTRIARELHDIVAHHMSVIAVQSSTAEYRLAGLGEDARAEFRSISDQARESLAEMRRLLGVLRSEDEAGAREPQPGPEALQGLAESVVRAGTPVDLVVGDLPAELPETVALTVFRVVQEALSNVVRHAPGAHVDASVAAEEGSVVVTVVNGPPPGGPAASSRDGSGLGLVGMRERVALDGGDLETGPTPEGGFRVRAVLPIRSTAEESA